jgi:hypothetical protein
MRASAPGMAGAAAAGAGSSAAADAALSFMVHNTNTAPQAVGRKPLDPLLKRSRYQ